MRGVIEMYKRYFRRFRLVLILATVSFFVVCAGDGVVVGFLGRYLVDEVLQVDLSARPVLDGQHDSGPSQTGMFHDDRAILGQKALPSEGLFEHRHQPQALGGELPAHDRLVDRVAARTGRTSAEKIALLLGVTGMMVAVHLLTVWLGAWAKVRFGVINKQVVFRLRREVFDKLLRLQMSYHDRHNVGRLISRAVEDIRLIEWQVAGIITATLPLIGTIVVSLGVMMAVNVKLSLAIVVTMPVFIAASWSFRRRIKGLARRQRHDMSLLYSLSADRLSHPRVVKGFGGEKRELRSFFKISVRMFRRRRRMVILKNVLTLICAGLSAGSLAIVLGYGTSLLMAGEISLGYLLLVYGAAAVMNQPMAQLGVQAMEAQHLVVVFERVLAVLGAPVTISDRAGSKQVPAMSDGITFEKVSLTYEGCEAPAIEDISLHIPVGSQVCLMGKSGAGKSTLAALLLRLYDPDEGRILVDSIDLRHIRNKSLRNQIAYVPQEPMLLSGTALQNITYGAPDADYEAVVRAAKAAEIHEFITSLPNGYRTMIGENGVRMSGGQKQRLSLARAMITDPQVLVLDDCTSALDAHTEARIRRTLRYALKGKTVVMISHRLSAAAASDLVVVMDHGRIVEQGTHNQLLALKDHYWRLVHDQADVGSDQGVYESDAAAHHALKAES